jgi:DegV family protein with EDD domain
VDSALSAQSEFSTVPVEIIDSFSTAAGLALVVTAVSQAVDEGKSFTEVRRIAVNAASFVQLFFMVDTLKYLHKGGRIGGASRLLGSALSIKPILYLDEDGKIDALDRVRTKQKALSRLIELAANIAAGRPAHVGILHADAYDLAVEFSQQIKAHIDCLQSDIYELSPVIGTHVGPGAIGVAIYPEVD